MKKLSQLYNSLARNPSGKYIPFIDGLRFLAIMMVALTFIFGIILPAVGIIGFERAVMEDAISEVSKKRSWLRRKVKPSLS
jgi:peptidoglycan/LPS O-acetylase OafA/YrhL